MRIRRITVLVAALAASAVLPPAASAQIPLGRYESRPGGVLLSLQGAFSPVWEPSGLTGSLTIATTGPVPAGESPTFVITASDLRLVELTGGGGLPVDLPPAGLQLTGLESVEAFNDRIVFESSSGSPALVRLELFPDGESFVLRGSSAAPGFVDYVAGVIFDWTGEGPQPAMRLDRGRFEVHVDWTGTQGGTGSGTPVKDDDVSGAFWFFRRNNPELQVKVVGACVPPFERVWFFASGLTDVGVTLRVRDLARPDDPERVYTNPAGRPFQPILDTEGFPCLALP